MAREQGPIKRIYIIGAAFSTALTLSLPASGADWGYDSGATGGESTDTAPVRFDPAYTSDGISDGKSLPPLRHVPEEMQAVPGALDLAGSQKDTIDTVTDTKSGVSDVKDPPVSVGGENESLIDFWLDILGLIFPVAEVSELPDPGNLRRNMHTEQMGRFKILLAKILEGKSREPFESVTSFWPSVVGCMKKKEEQLANYRLLFRALLRQRAESKDVDESERQLLLEALGPQRLAVDGDPPLTEEAINAYTDMACFLYSQNNPMRTIDADDNRELFSKVVKLRFEEAPSENDKRAMNYFPASWAKFRIMYVDATDPEKKLLEQKIISDKGLAGIKLNNSVLESVLRSPLWTQLSRKK